MKLSSLISRFAEWYVDSHEEELCEAIMDAMSVDLDEVAATVADTLDDLSEKVSEEVLNRL